MLNSQTVKDVHSAKATLFLNHCDSILVLDWRHLCSVSRAEANWGEEGDSFTGIGERPRELPREDSFEMARFLGVLQDLEVCAFVIVTNYAQNST